MTLFDELFSLLPIELQSQLKSTLQARKYHSEGSVYTHIKMVSDLLPADDVNLQACALFHDIAKPLCTKVNEKYDKISIQSIGHENYACQFIDQFQLPTSPYLKFNINWEMVREISYYHMRMHKYLNNEITKPNKRKFMENLIYFEGLRQFAIADAEGRIIGEGKPYVIICCGPPGSGKSTWARKFAVQSGYQIINPDNIRLEVTGNISDQTQNAKVWELAYHRLKEMLDNKQDIIFDSCACNIRTIKSLKTIVKEKEAIIIFKLFDTDIDVCKQRIKEDIECEVVRSNVPDEVVNKMAKGFIDVKKYLLENNDLIITVKE